MPTYIYVHTNTEIYMHAYTLRLMYGCQYTYLNLYIHIEYVCAPESHDADTGANSIT